MSQDIDVSIIIPVYNGVPYLEKCINSLEKQNHNLLRIEILFIDDASEDNSVEYIKSFNLKNIKIIKSKTNKGPSAARNIGIKNALGEYIFFQDVDDNIENNALETLFSKAKYYNSDFVFSDHKRIEDLKDQRENRYDFNEEVVFSKEKIIQAMKNEYDNPNTGHLGLFGCNGRLIKRSLLFEKNILFDESLKWNEDKTFAWLALSHVEKAIYVKDKLYSFYVNPNVQTAGIVGLSSNFSLDNIKSITKHIDQSLKNKGFNQEERIKLTQKTLIFHAIKVLISFSIRLLLNKIEFKKGVQLRKKMIKEIIFDEDIKLAIKNYKPSKKESFFLPKAINYRSIFFLEFFCNLRAKKIIKMRRSGKV
jgi:glycosyltransferase involved in cell wall biosynthesis|tara:strand:+ start:2017 stop:3108 length:1092 start_codon:yes stop_codon:yes gene_type:complete